MELCKQQADYDCMSACITTLVQRPYEELWPEDFRAQVQEKKGVFGDTIDLCFEMVGLEKNVDYWCVTIPQWCSPATTRQLLRGRRAIIQVRSLNNPSAGHFIYWTGTEVHDVSNKQLYRWLDIVFPEYVWIFDEAQVRRA